MIWSVGRQHCGAPAPCDASGLSGSAAIRCFSWLVEDPETLDWLRGGCGSCKTLQGSADVIPVSSLFVASGSELIICWFQVQILVGPPTPIYHYGASSARSLTLTLTGSRVALVLTRTVAA